MTTKQKYQAVAQAIRQEFPRLMEVDEGCSFYLEDGTGSKKVEIISIKGNTFLVRNELGEIYDCSKDFLKEKFDIIGKEPMLNDVLEWFCIMYSNKPDDCRIPTSIDFDGMFFRWGYDKDIWDLSKPYLKDQSEELINFLYELTE